MSEPFEIVRPRAFPVPIVISAPHVGVEFPASLASAYKPEFLSRPEDTDWFVHELYDFAPDLGITLVFARYSRYVIDLNRSPDSAPLYHDGRKETGLIPLTTFSGRPIYQDSKAEAAAKSEAERLHRSKTYYEPYHACVEALLKEARTRSPHVLLFEAHSIHPIAPGIAAGRLPDLMLGDGGGTTAATMLTKIAQEALSSSPFSLSSNHPFKGGYLTRKFGKPKTGVHALQLEMSQSTYMDETFRELDAEKARRIRPVLRECLARLARALPGLG